MRFASDFTLSTLLGFSFAANTEIAHQFPNPSWVENLAATRHGSILTNAGVFGVPPAELHLVTPFSSTNESTLIHSFPSAGAIFGITEYEPDVFAVAVANISLQTFNGTGDVNLYRVDLSSKCGDATEISPKVSLLAYLPDAQINGLAALNSNTLLYADSWAGRIGAVDVKTGRHNVLLEDEHTANNVSAPLPLGADGLSILRSEPVPSSQNIDPTLYFTNCQLGSLFTVRIDSITGAIKGPVKTVAKSIGATIDDFAIADDGSVFMARWNPNNDVVRVGLDGDIVPIAGDISGPTAVVFGRTGKDWGKLYVSTTGRMQANGTFAEGGQIVAVDLTTSM